MLKDFVSTAFGSQQQASSLISSAQTILGSVIDPSMMKIINQFDGFLDSLTSLQEVKIKEVNLQTNTYAKIIPNIFGIVRISGNLIWSTDITVTKTNDLDVLGKVLIPGKTTYRASFAIALCEGEIDDVLMIYANGQILNLYQLNVQIYKGTQTQLPNSTMQSILGSNKTPAFRGLAYIVFTNFPLENYNGAMPNFTFDVKKTTTKNQQKIQNLIKGVCIIPATGQFVYDTIPQYYYTGNYVKDKPIVRVTKNTPFNLNNNEGITDFMVSMNQMQKTMPNLKYASIVNAWFFNSTDIANCTIEPGLEHFLITEPDIWTVGKYVKQTSTAIVKDSKGAAIYGGTSADCAILRAIEELKRRGLKTCFYPMMFNNNIKKEWRGRITGKATDVPTFFNKEKGYNEFILHYANLLKNKVDSFIIGTELVGITKIKDENNNFVAVKELVKLAKQVKSIMGNYTKIIYAADWSEYHHTEGGWYHLDELWSCDAIDVIGIDAYFPLTLSTQTIYDEKEIEKCWTSAEGYDFYYEDSANKTNPKPLSPEYAWKNIRWFWQNEHWNPNGTKTSWIPKSKKIWFTEYGFPSVDCSTNQPNVFYSQDSIESKFPLYSKGSPDFKIQRQAILATQNFLNKNRDMIEEDFIWTWDARPYPFFPSMSNVWADTKAWQYGHFLNGKLGNTNLADLIRQLCLSSGLEEEDFDIVSLDQDINGYIIDSKSSAIEHLIILSELYSFDGVYKDGKIIFKSLSNTNVYNINFDDIKIENDIICFNKTQIQNKQNSASGIEVIFQDKGKNYQISTIKSQDLNIKNNFFNTYKINIAMSEAEAKNIANSLLIKERMRTKLYKMTLSSKYKQLNPLDVVILQNNQNIETIRIKRVLINQNQDVEIEGISDDLSLYKMHTMQFSPPASIEKITRQTPLTQFEIIDAPNFENEDTTKPYFYLSTYCDDENWNGCGYYISYDNGVNYSFITTVEKESIFAKVLNAEEKNTNTAFEDKVSQITICLTENAEKIESIDENSFLNFGNLCLIGDEIISFQNAKLISYNTFQLTNLTRALFGTKKTAKKFGDRFILLDKNYLTKIEVPYQYINCNIAIKAVSIGSSFESSKVKTFNFSANNLKSFPVVEKSCIKKQNEDFEISFIPKNICEKKFFFNDPKYTYFVQILNNSEVIKTVECKNINTFLYSKEDQIKDFGQPQDTLSYQIIENLYF